MPLSDLLKAIQAEADDEIAADRRTVQAEADAVVAEASVKAAALERELEVQAGAEARVEAGRRLAAARLAAAARVRSAREDAFLALRTELVSGLRATRDTRSYPELLAQLIRGAMEALPDTTRLRIDPRDAELALEQVADIVPAVTLDPSLQTWGGVEAVNAGGRSVVNTLEQRLADAESRLRIFFARAIVNTGEEHRR
ncbi:hypothetical protein [Arthrobacter sp. CG_A4]|uniref:hypothetical protein n=1 Tax=Arthrobacter sp. CG_A4 TaxID=3071706 RepID=UPI002E05E673|nr:V/A-type H+-transporting ATPase subunit E [Arthrobacter sp. CG_A4]